MFVLLMIVVLAILALWLSHSERQHSVVLIVTGVLCIVLGGRAFALLSVSCSGEYLSTVYADDASSSATATIAEHDGGSAALPQPVATAAKTDATHILTSKDMHELAIEPTPTFRYLTLPRPEWIETEASKTDDSYQIAVESGLHVRKRVAQQTLREEVKAAVDTYAKDYLQSELASTLAGYSIEEIESEAVRTISLRLEDETFPISTERFDEQVEFDYGVMNQSHALVKLNKDVQKALEKRWSKVRATSRLFQTGLGTTAVLLLLGTMFTYLRLDTATRGYYTGRLQFGAAAAILAVIAAGVVFANRIPWM
ncbi:MAG: hypothetical protein H6822_26425 [Planctomycetaceae bacterium]|nr:hypothetical protein [Planctomycetales bacterium]MCB9925714.1 hypothetical protein [Planctomycetaceae bacterium]